MVDAGGEDYLHYSYSLSPQHHRHGFFTESGDPSVLASLRRLEMRDKFGDSSGLASLRRLEMRDKFGDSSGLVSLRRLGMRDTVACEMGGSGVGTGM